MVKSLILCEGPNDIKFFALLCKYLECDKQVHIKKMDGKSNFFKTEKYDTTKQQVDTDQYHKVLLVVDADFVEYDANYGGFENSTTQLNGMIQSLGFNDKASIHIMCDPETKEGNLEHLILSTIDSKEKGCIESFLNCINPMNTCSNKKIVLSSYETIFKEEPYSFDHQNFDDIKSKITQMVNS
ncbi:MAG: hypothetical protein Q9M28_04375 [Mariprofundaceae bacterium]|nr:hypothetical protein [Mariprofundaceae bacterium]